MTKRNFANLENGLKADILREDGVYIGKAMHGESIITLYQLNTFYVAVHYTAYRKAIEKYVLIDDPAKIGSFIDQVNISEFITETLQ
ncbi:hypothetical protein [Aridibaculum aurantiacum]|uniref:hypothetical protein n=1 Tax=Aridibaculum aurantiacum TaxID=2810307 RepID=UPI001A95B90A|nr:hypothetical protein [Aridibaculum aurantiacum]